MRTKSDLYDLLPNPAFFCKQVVIFSATQGRSGCDQWKDQNGCNRFKVKVIVTLRRFQNATQSAAYADP